MNNIEKIEYSQQLADKKEELEKELANLEEKIMENQSDCEHVSVIMNAVDTFPKYGRSNRCLLCGYSLPRPTELCVDARNYLVDTYDDRIDSQRVEKFDVLQTMALGILRQNLGMTREEFVNYFNNMIQESIALKADGNNQESAEYIKDLVKKEGN